MWGFGPVMIQTQPKGNMMPSNSSNLKTSTASIDTEFDSLDFEQALAAEDTRLSVGSKVHGVVVKVSEKEVFVDIQYKAEGRLPCSEFGNQLPREGDEIEAVFTGEDEDGNIRISVAQLQRSEIEEKLQEGNVLPARVAKLLLRKKDKDGEIIENPVPVGFHVELAPGITAFVPLSQMDLHPAPPESYIDATFDFRIERIEQKGRYRNIVVNRRKLLEEELHKKQREFFDSHRIGDIVSGQVRSFVEFGAFIDLGGFSGLLHVGNIAWHQVKKPQEHLNIGEKLELQICDLNPAAKKIGLSRKALLPNPWDEVGSKYYDGQIVEGRVVRLQTYGAFIELEPAVEGLVHVSEMSWIKQIKSPKEIMKPGDQVKVKILEMDLENQRIRLGLRQTQPNPWLTVAERYPVGSRLSLNVKNLSKTAAFLNIEEGIDGCLHQDDISWTKTPRIEDAVQPGQTLEVQILSIDAEQQRIRLGLKQLESNPWQELKSYKKGTVIEGKVVGKKDFGIFVAVNGGIEGLVHKNDLTNNRSQNSEELLKSYKAGDTVRALIVEIDEGKHRLGLSIRAMERNEERQSIERYVLKNDDADTGYTIGDAINKAEPR